MALEMRQHMETLIDTWRHRSYQLHVGIGIAHSHATLGMIGFEGRVDYAAIGPVTNLASRLCDHAEVGQILISQPVFTAMKHEVEAEPVGKLSLKGLAEPVPAFNVLECKATR
jgi:adenylate cyclase